MRAVPVYLLLVALTLLVCTLGARAQHAQNILRGTAARDYLVSAATSGDVGVQAAVAEADSFSDSDLIAKLAIDEDLAYDVLEKKFLYACAALAVPDELPAYSLEAESAIEIAADVATGVSAGEDVAVAPASYAGPDAVDPAPSLDTVFKLHSRPQSIRKVYLDFNGHITSGTAWNNNVRSFTSPPYSLDDSPDFSYVELQAIIS